jgi:Chalcone isomerase-like
MRMPRRILFIFVTTLTLATGASAQVKLEGQSFAPQLRLAESDLRLNGVGLRAVAWIKGYAAGLYLQSKTSSPAQALAASGAKRLQLRMLMEVPAAEFTKAIASGITRNTTSADMPALLERMHTFEQRVQALGTVRKGDVDDIDWLPGSGLLLSLNGVAKGAPIAGDDFYAALLKIFIGDKPVDPELKTGLLGGPAS